MVSGDQQTLCTLDSSALGEENGYSTVRAQKLEADTRQHLECGCLGLFSPLKLNALFSMVF